MAAIALTDIKLAAGFRLPFFPMRPWHGLTISSREDFLERLKEPGYDYTLKLDGDRACVAVVDGDTFVQNRHGSAYRMTVNLERYAKLPGVWLLDGEIYKKEFYPFEVLVAAGASMARLCPSVRKQAAMTVCGRVDVLWMYGTRRDMADAFQQPEYEGIVAKRLASPYITVGSASKESPSWVKMKWR